MPASTGWTTSTTTRPSASRQVMHPDKCWEWRELPVQVSLPETLPGGWRRLTDDTLGEAGMAALLGSQLKNLDRGLRLARGWEGDRAALYEGPHGARLLAWASSWESPSAAERFARACAEERSKVHKAVLTRKPGRPLAWTRPDGGAGIVRCEGKHALLMETDKPSALAEADAGAGPATFTEPPQEAARAAANKSFLRLNPLLSRRRDGDYSVTKSLWGLLERHDQNSVGAADRHPPGHRRRMAPDLLLCQMEASAGAWLPSTSPRPAARITKTTLLPWGVLGSHFSTPVPQNPSDTLSRDTLLWGLAASRTSVANGTQSLRILPGGLLFRTTSAPGKRALHILGTGVSHTGASTRFRLFCIPLRTTHTR